MHFLIRAAFLLAAGAAGWALAKCNSRRDDQTSSEPHVVYLEDEDAVIAENNVPPEPVRAEVLHCYRRMDPITLTGASDVTFILQDGTEVKLIVQGEGGLHLNEGDAGLLTWQGMQFILFEKDSGELVGGMFYAPAEEEAHE